MIGNLPGDHPMTALAFDTLAYVKRLKAAGVPEAQAEVQAEVLAEIVKDQLATKQDLRELELRLETKLAETKAEIIRWTIGTGIFQTALIAALLLKLVH
jgi:hypothetical protein